MLLLLLWLLPATLAAHLQLPNAVNTDQRFRPSWCTAGLASYPYIHYSQATGARSGFDHAGDFWGVE